MVLGLNNEYELHDSFQPERARRNGFESLIAGDGANEINPVRAGRAVVLSTFRQD